MGGGERMCRGKGPFYVWEGGEDKMRKLAYKEALCTTMLKKGEGEG